MVTIVYLFVYFIPQEVVLHIPAEGVQVQKSDFCKMVFLDNICIFGTGLELACNGGSYGGISLNRDKCPLHLKRLPVLASLEASSSPIPAI